MNNVDWKCYYMFGVGLSAIGNNKNTAVYYPLGFGLFWKLIFKKLRVIYWLCHRNIWTVLIQSSAFLHFKPYKGEQDIRRVYPGSTEWVLTRLCKYTLFCVVSSHSNTFSYYLYSSETYSAKAVFMLQCWIQVSKCCKVSFNMLQSQFIFYKGSEHENWEDFAFAVGDPV